MDRSFGVFVPENIPINAGGQSDKHRKEFCKMALV
jgi:hypothetical protein